MEEPQPEMVSIKRASLEIVLDRLSELSDSAQEIRDIEELEALLRGDKGLEL